MVKSYLRYEARSVFGIISSPTGNAVFDHSGKLSITPALENVIVWDIKKGTQVARWSDSENKAEVTCIARNPNGKDYAVGYADGSIRLFDLTNNAVNVILNGHRGSISALEFDPTGTVLASGARDTDLILWDVVGEVGLYKLRGHKDEITGIAFLPSSKDADSALNASSEGYIVTSSKDTLVKLWDLRARHCVQTLVTHRSEVWSLAVSPDRRLLVTGTSDMDMRVWSIDIEKLEDTSVDRSNLSAEDAAKSWEAITEYGTIQRASKDRVVDLQFHPTGLYLACLSSDKQVEVFRTRTHAEIKKKMARRQKRTREKRKKDKDSMDADGDESNSGGSGDEADENTSEITAADELTSFKVIRTSAKPVSLDFNPTESDIAALHRQSSLQILVSQNNNSLHTWNLPIPPPGKTTKQANLPEPSLMSSIEMLGHRSEPRTLALSSDNELIASAANKSLRVWNAQTGSCIRTLECGTALCAVFLPGDQLIVIGTKEGTLELYDIPSASLVETFDAHEGAACWSIDVRPDKKGLVTGGADKCVKFWDFELVREPQGDSSVVSRRRMTLEHVKTLKMSDDVLVVKCSPDSRLLAVSLLDTTVKVFYADTLKFFLSLYGHKLPVVSMDISSDSTLLVTGSADKSVKLWGLDFGDCHRSILAHQEPVTAVKFVWGTHYFFSAGKDKLVQQWDGDNFQRIQKLEGSHGDVWALLVAKHGNFIVASSQDRSIRVWDKTEEPLFLEEERERELEEIYDRGLEESLDRKESTIGRGDGEDEEMEGEESQRAGKATMETLKAGERIMEALELADEERKKWHEFEERKRKMPQLNPAPPDTNPVLMFEKLSPEAYVLRTVERIRAAELEDALLALPFSRVLSLMAYIDIWARREWNTPITCRVLFFVLKTHQNQIVATRTMRAQLDSIRQHLRAGVNQQRDQIGYNLAALSSLRTEWEENATAQFFDEKDIQSILDGQLKKRKFTGIKA
ncbi:beta transducin [Kickxella alabastrina]|uniref:Beta transducin n=1 Tax=Kickxella alabastrina TaxID=61397 RepID=A0ACC1IS31_9FUNG|nr:beta transducin [Kickxella alabastrina]